MIRLILSGALWLVVALIGIVVVPVALIWRTPGISIREQSGMRLPTWAQWWDDPLNTMCGDQYWRADHHPMDYDTPFVMWLWYLRNPATGFGCKVLGVWGKQIVSCERKGSIIIGSTARKESIRMLYVDRGWVKIKLGPDLTNYTTPGRYWLTFSVAIHGGQ